MQTLEYHTADKSSWGEGEWQNEPDKKQWRDEATGYPCLIVRAAHCTGSLCGYVGVSKNHPLYEKEYGTVDINVHGGLTYSDKCTDFICHEVEKGEDEEIWWFGFDCAHFMDFTPMLEMTIKKLIPDHDRSFLGTTYRNIAYVENECRSLAKQLKEAA